MNGTNINSMIPLEFWGIGRLLVGEYRSKTIARNLLPGNRFRTNLVNSTPFALQDDDLQQLGCVALWVLTWITCQNLRGESQVNPPITRALTDDEPLRQHFYLLAHAINDLQVFGLG